MGLGIMDRTQYGICYIVEDDSCCTAYVDSGYSMQDDSCYTVQDNSRYNVDA